MIIYILFSILLAAVFAYYFAFESFRYKAAKKMAKGLGGNAVFMLGRSYMKRYYDGVEERVWMVPVNKTTLGDDFTEFLPSPGKLFLQRKRDPGFRFTIEPRTGLLFRTLSFDSLKETVFHVPQLDEVLRLRTDNPAAAAHYFSWPEKQKALSALFHAGFKNVKGDGSITAAMHGISEKDIDTERIGRYLGLLRCF